ncbi:MAG: hypothetical protein WD627_04605 [Actinomycetota bacterium]
MLKTTREGRIPDGLPLADGPALAGSHGRSLQDRVSLIVCIVLMATAVAILAGTLAILVAAVS